MSAAPLRVCFVGCGNIASYHLAAAIASKRVLVTCFVDPSPDARAALQAKLSDAISKGDALEGQPARPQEHESLQDALAADGDSTLFDACDIMVPSFVNDGDDLHESVASLALRGQRHVLLEKPVCTTAEAAERLILLHQHVAQTKVFAVAENSRFWPEIIAAKACIDEGGIGEVISARGKFWESAGGEWACDYLPGTWRCDRDKLPAASFTFDGVSHWIRPLRLWFGEVGRIAGVAGRTLEHMPGVSWSQHIVSFKSGKAAILESMLAPRGISDQPFFTIQGTSGEIVIDGFAGGCSVHSVDEFQKPAVRELCREGWDAGYLGEYEDFAAAVLDGVGTQGSAAEALADLQVVCALFRSAEKGTWESPIG